MRRNFLLAATLAAAVSASGASASVITDIYSGHSNGGSGTPFTGLVGSLSTAGVTFATDTGFNWHPFGLGDFGSDSHGTLTAASAGTYTFSLNSDDGSKAFIDGVLVLDDSNAHGPFTVTNTVGLSAGAHTFEVQFFECCGGASGVDFTTPEGITLGGGVPEPASWALMLVGFGGLGAALRHRRRRLAVA